MGSVTLSLPEAYDWRWRCSAPMDSAPTTRRPSPVTWLPGSATAALPTACGGCWALSIPCVKVRFRLMPSRRSTIRRRRLCGWMPGRLSLLAYERALPLLLEKARHSGIAALAINRCVHFSALFADIEPLTEAGLVGLACTPSHARSPRRAAPVRCSALTLSPLAGRGGRSRRLLLIWRPAPRRAARSSCISAPAKRYRKGGESTAGGSRRPMPQRY